MASRINLFLQDGQPEMKEAGEERPSWLERSHSTEAATNIKGARQHMEVTAVAVIKESKNE